MEYASEMVVKAGLYGLKTIEVPTTLSPDGRSRASHLRTWSDGWRHLRFLLLFSPRWLFLIPGTLMFGLGLFFLLALARGPISVAGLHFDIHYMVLGSLLSLIGYQTCVTGVFATVYSVSDNFVRKSITLNILTRYFNLEKGLLLGGAVSLVGLGLNLYILIHWIQNNFGTLNLLREAIIAMTLMVIGIQTIFSSFFISLLSIQKKTR